MKKWIVTYNLEILTIVLAVVFATGLLFVRSSLFLRRIGCIIYVKGPKLLQR